MWKLIVVTFGFLGVVFYQLSGGAEFAPQTAEEEAIAARPVLEEPVAEVDAVAPEAVTRREDSVSLVGHTATPAGAVQDLLPVKRSGARYEASFSVLPTPDPAPSAEVAPATTQDAEREELAQDLREVTGSRVNLRGGPGTAYEVVGRLTRGDHVAVIEDDGFGWVQLEVLDTGETGWMADFLLAPL